MPVRRLRVLLRRLPGRDHRPQRRLAWGLTNLGADVTDFFIERTSIDTYLRDGASRPLDSAHRDDPGQRRRGRRADRPRDRARADRLRRPARGAMAAWAPLAPESPVGTTRSRCAWTALTPGRTADAVFAFNRATDAADIAEAAAPVRGARRRTSSSRRPTATSATRRRAHPGARRRARPPVPADGAWPQPGWDSRYDWQGYVDPAQMPAASSTRRRASSSPRTRR